MPKIDKASSTKRDAFMTALLQHSTIGAAARAAKVSSRQASRYMADDAFIDELQTRRGVILDGICARLMTAQGQAVNVLIDLMNGESVAGTVRLAAAKAIIDAGLKSQDMTARFIDGEYRRKKALGKAGVDVDAMNAQIISLADLIKHPEPNISIDEILNDAQGVIIDDV